MSRYESAYYGSTSPPSYYGEPGGQYDATPFTAVAVRYNQILLAWRTINGVWDRLRLVRNRNSFPEVADDGTILFDLNCGPNASPAPTGGYGGGDYGAGVYGGDGTTNPTAPISYSDTGLKAGFWYYSLFVRDITGGVNHWRRVGDAMGQACDDLGYGDYLAQRLPRFLLNDDAEIGGEIDTSSALYRYLGIFGLELSRIRGLYDAIMLTNDPDHMPGPFLPHLAKELGFCYEPNIGMRHNRVLLRNAVRLAQLKGTSKGVTALASSVTGWGCTQGPLKNLIHTQDDSSADRSVGLWSTGNTVGLAVTRAVITPPADNAFTSRAGVFHVTGNGGLGGTVGLYWPPSGAISTLQAIKSGVPVVAGTTYTTSVYLQCASTQTATLTVKWFDKTGNSIANTTGTLSISSGSGAWTRMSVSAAAPAGAMFAAFLLSMPADFYFDSLQFEAAASASAYLSARSIDLTLIASRINQLPNGGFDSSTTGWTAQAASFTQNTTVTYDGGLGSAKLSGTMDNASFGITSVQVPWQPGQVASASLKYVQGNIFATIPPVANLAIYFLDSGGHILGTIPSAVIIPFTTNDLNWHTLAINGAVAPANTVAAQVVFQAQGYTGDTIYVDDVILEKSNVAGPYFDTRENPGDVFWEGTVGNSRTHYYPNFVAKSARLTALLPEYLPLLAEFQTLYAQPGT